LPIIKAFASHSITGLKSVATCNFIKQKTNKNPLDCLVFWIGELLLNHEKIIVKKLKRGVKKSLKDDLPQADKMLYYIVGMKFKKNLAGLIKFKHNSEIDAILSSRKNIAGYR